MSKQELSFGDKKEVCKVVLHRLIQVSLAHLSPGPLWRSTSPKPISSSLPQSLDYSCHEWLRRKKMCPKHLCAKEVRAGAVMGTLSCQWEPSFELWPPPVSSCPALFSHGLTQSTRWSLSRGFRLGMQCGFRLLLKR